MQHFLRLVFYCLYYVLNGVFNESTFFFVLLSCSVAKAEEVKMPVSNLAKVFGPTIVGYSSADPDQHAIFTETIIQASVSVKPFFACVFESE